MKKKYDPQLIQEDLKKLIQQTLREALEAELEEFLGYSKYKEKKTTTVTAQSSQKGYFRE